MPEFDAIPAVNGWFKSTRSGGSSNCVDVNHLPDGATQVRHSKEPDGLVLTFTVGMWARLLEAIGAHAFPQSTDWKLAGADHSGSAQARLAGNGSVEFTYSDAGPCEVLAFTAEEWGAFAAGVHAGEFAWRLPTT